MKSGGHRFLAIVSVARQDVHRLSAGRGKLLGQRNKRHADPAVYIDAVLQGDRL